MDSNKKNTATAAINTDQHKFLAEQGDAISKCLIDARLSARPLPDFPVHVPDTLEQAYAIQSASIARWPDEIVGWKVARLSDADRERLSAERLVGPVFRSSVRRVEKGSSTTMPVYEGGFAAIEAEIVLELGRAVLPSDNDYTDEELIGFVAAAYCGAEIASSPMAVVNERGATSVVADLGINAGVFVGPEIPDWHSLPANSVTVAVTVDGRVVGEATIESLTGSPLQAFRFLVDHCAQNGIVLPRGTLVSSGALTGVHDVKIASATRVDYAAWGYFDVSYKPIAAKR